MNIKSIKITDQTVCLAFISINFILATLIGFFDEGLNNFSFLLDPTSLITVIILGFIFTALPVVIYFLLQFLNLNKNKRVKISAVFQLLIIVLLILVY